MKFFRGKKKSRKEIDAIPFNLSKNLKKNITRLKDDFGHSSDFVVEYFKLGNNKYINCACIYINSLVDRNIINNLSRELTKVKSDSFDLSLDKNFNSLMNLISGLRVLKESSNYEALCTNLLSGDTVFLMEGYNKFFAVVTNIDEGRSIEEPTSQSSIRGAKEGFTERIDLNILLIRKRMKEKSLRVENLFIGSITKTVVSLMYVHNIAEDEIVQEVKERLEKIEINGILEGGYIEELIKDDRYSIFPTFLNTERPDTATAALLEGKVAILVDGTPYVLIVPALMIDFFQASEDYYHHYIIASMTRLLRFVAFFLTLLVPSLYVSLTTFHQEMIPTALLVSIAAQREDVPFPALIEALIMEITFEILREAGVRMPRAIGSAISIVGALVIGQAAVEAGIISALMVIVVSITAISSFTITNYEMSNAARLIRFILMVLAGMLGLYGVFVGLIVMTLHLCKIKSIGIPYMKPIAPKIKGRNKDTIFRFPLWKMNCKSSENNNLNDKKKRA